MVAWFLCQMCRPVPPFPEGPHRTNPSGELSEPYHCHGSGDRPALPGVLGGFQCSCDCRHRVREGEGHPLGPLP